MNTFKQLALFAFVSFCFMSEIEGMQQRRSSSAPSSPTTESRGSRRGSEGSLTSSSNTARPTRSLSNPLTSSDPRGSHTSSSRSIMDGSAFEDNRYGDMGNNRLCPTINDCLDLAFGCCCSAPRALLALCFDVLRQ